MPQAADLQPLRDQPSETDVGVGVAVPSQSGIRWAAKSVQLNDEDPPANDVRNTQAEDVSDLLQTVFRLAVNKTDADVGLLHKRTDAFLFTTGVHRLEPAVHMLVGVSLWDPAVQQALQGRVSLGPADANTETATIARRLGHGSGPSYVLCIPIVIGRCIEAVIELGRNHSPFVEGIEKSLLAIVNALVGR